MWSLFLWSQYNKIFHQRLFFFLRSESSTAPSCHVLSWRSQVLPFSWGFAHEHDVSRSLDCQRRSKENLCKVGMRWQRPLLFLKMENYRKSQVSDTCLNLDGTSPNCSDSLAHKVNIHLSRVFLELRQDLQGKCTNVSPQGHAKRISPSDKRRHLRSRTWAECVFRQLATPIRS